MAIEIVTTLGRLAKKGIRPTARRRVVEPEVITSGSDGVKRAQQGSSSSTRRSRAKNARRKQARSSRKENR